MERTCKRFALLLVLLLCLIMTGLAMKTPNITTDQSALLAFKAHITSDPFQFLSRNWTAGSSVCDWIGVTCGSRHRRVTALRISDMSIVGTIPPHLGNLSFLVFLDLRNNSLHGNLPNELVHLYRLKVLDLEHNYLSGAIPKWIGLLSKLRYLLMQNNSFSGLIPPSVSNLSNLEMLYLSFNSLEGTVPIGIGNLYHLKKLAIEYNHLSGSLPLGIFNISSLDGIGLMHNFLSGGLPNHICGRLPRLEWLGLSMNEFSGEIPLNLSQCSKLKYLALNKNNFNEAYLPKEIGNLQMLEELYLGRNNLKGVIPKEIGHLTMLKYLSLRENNLIGEIPKELGNLRNLEELHLGFNHLSGHIPEGVYNLSKLGSIDFVGNSLSGQLPSNIGLGLPNLEKIYFGQNQFHGVIPDSISNCSKLILLDVSANNFMGSIPETLGDLNHLQILDVENNQFKSKSSSQDLDFFIFLSKCKELRYLMASDNPLDGLLPVLIGNLSKSVKMIGAGNCIIKGRIPSGIANLSNLFQLDLHRNQLTGSVPSSIQDFQDLQILDLSYNKLGGSIPGNLCGLQNLGDLYLEGNQIFGSLPDCFGNMTSLRSLILGSNRLTSTIPTSLWNLKDLLKLNLSSNYFSGSLSLRVGNLKAAIQIDLTRNHFSGDFPKTIPDLQNLMHLSLAHNRIQGSIPESLGNISNLEFLDLSHNNISGLIPRSLENLRYLKYFNVSFNKLRGEIPSRGPFEKFTSQSFIFNDALCGPSKFKVPPCQNMPSEKLTKSMHRLLFLLLLLVLPLATITLGLLHARYRNKDEPTNVTNSWSMITAERISYHELFHATNGYDECNLLGAGSFGTVYKGILNDGRTVAIKVFNLLEERAFGSFEKECRVLCSIRHRNLTKVISSCSKPNFKALILEFMPNGSLEKWLYSHNYFLDIMQRLNIMIDVACALQYLHFGNSTKIVHCDLKPSNVLLDQDMVAHVSDFGVAKLLDSEKSKSYTETLATLGYIAPEYGLEGLVSTECDVYSFGILLMEVFTRQKPTDEMFNQGWSLRDWVNSSVSDTFAQVVDANLLEGEEYSSEKLKCISSIFQVALNCSMDSARNRKNMGDVVVALEKIKHQLSSYHKMHRVELGAVKGKMCSV